MAETTTKPRRNPPDPNSAKYKLGKIADDAYATAREAKARGEMIGWCASNFPVEIPETLGLAVVYPENQAAGIAARGAGVQMCEEAESEGYSNDICAYARVSLAYAKLKEAPVEPNVPMPDFVLCCNNICNCMIKWYENLSKELGIPMFIIDIPFNPDYEVSDAQIAYVRAQFWDCIHGLEKLTGKKWSDERYKEVMETSGRTSRAWLAATACARYTPSPFNGFDLLNHMAVMVTARGKKEAAEAMELLLKEYEQNHVEGKSTFRVEEKYRIMFEGIACWPWLRVTSTGLKSRGINMVTTIYADAFGFIYKDFDGPLNKGQCFMAVDLARMTDIKAFKERMDTQIAFIKASPAAPFTDEVYLPGEIEWKNNERQLRDGIVYPVEILKEINTIATNYSIPVPKWLAPIL